MALDPRLRCIVKLKGHMSAPLMNVNALSADETYVATGGTNGDVLVWKLEILDFKKGGKRSYPNVLLENIEFL